MKHVLFRSVSLTVIILMAITSTSQAGYNKTAKTDNGKDKQVHRALRGNVDVSRALAYSFPDEKAATGTAAGTDGTRIPLGSVDMTAGMMSPGVIVGNTWYDYQHNCSMGRMIGTGPHSGESGYAIVHMGWMYLPSKKLEDRSYAYAAYLTEDHSLVGPLILMNEDDYAGYVNVHVTPDNRAVIGGHNNPAGEDTKYSCEFHFQGGPGYPYFPQIIRVPDSVQDYGQNDPTEYAIWPKFFVQFGTDTVLHAAAQVADNDINAQAMMYFRKPGFEGSTDTEWDYPPWIVDSVQAIAQDISGVRNGDRVAMTWVAGLPYQVPECDTCSGITIYDGYLIGQMDNDVYYQQSFDQGVSWQPRVNVTKAPIGEASLKAFCDLSMLFDTADNLHLVWHACPWPADLCWDEGGFCFVESWYVDNARLIHWSEDNPWQTVIADQVYAVQNELWDSCSAGEWALRIAKPTISECDGKLYTIWTQFNNPREGVIDDCADWGYDGDPAGAANGEIWFSVSLDAGLSWSEAVNLTNSYTPHCDPMHNEVCQSDYWASMSPYGRQVEPGEDWSAAYIVDPTGAYAGDYYLDIQFVNDLDAGGIVQSEGSWTDNPIKWFRLPCVEYPPTTFCPFVSPQEFWDWIYLGQSTSFPVTIENLSGSELTYTVTIEQDNGPEGWITVAGLDGVLQTYPTNVDEGTIYLNQNHVISSEGIYYGRVIIDFPEATCTDTVEITLDVTTPPPPIFWDSVQTSCLGLIANHYGNMGRGGHGKENMDYVRYGGDCDTTAIVYMYEGSPIVGYLRGVDTLFYSTMWGAYYTDYTAFRPLDGRIPTKYCSEIDAEVFETGTFITQDSNIAMEKIYVAPQSACNFIIEYRRVWSLDGEPHEGVIVAEGIDWDIPTDFLVTDTNQANRLCNIGGVDAARNLVYCQGYEAYGAGSDTAYPYNCQYNDARFGGNAFVESYFNGSQYKTYAVRGIAATNDSLQVNNGWLAGELYKELTYTTGFTATDSIVDLNTVLVFETDLSLGATDVYEAVTILATIKEGTLADLQAAIDDAKAWYAANGGMSMFADINDDGQIDVCESCCVTMGKFYSDGQPFSILDIDDFTEWLLRNPGVPNDYDCLEQTDVSGPTPGVPDGAVSILDLDYLIGYLLRDDYPTLGLCP